MINQLVKYGIAGLIGTAARYVVMYGLIRQNVSPVAATTIGAVIGAFVNYLVSFHWVFRMVNRFRSATLFDHRTFTKFSTTAMAVVITNSFIFSLLLNCLPTVAAQLCATAAAFFVGYALNRCWTFAPLESSS